MIVAVSACPRDEGISYTEGTVASIVAAGAKSPIMVFDDLNWIGSAKACHQLLKDCYDAYPETRVLLCEDDIVACKNAVAAVERLSFPTDTHMLSFFQCRRRYTPRAPKGIDFETVDVLKCYKYSGSPILNGIHLKKADETFMYAQALLLSPQLVEFIAKTEWPADQVLHLSKEEVLHMAPYSIRDKALGWFAGQVGKYIGQVAPNWFQHIGKMSAATASMFRKQIRTRDVIAGNWLGEEHDALTDDVSKLYWLQ